jgi:RsiW-degrading membrane proteinase PrsW (M82 family)
MLWDSMIGFLKSWFNYPGVEWGYMLAGIALAIVFGGIWLLGLQPTVNKKPGLWAVAIISAFLTLLAISFVQIPLQYYTGKAITSAWSTNTISDWLLLVGIPQILISGLVQEGAKMVPIVFWWLQSGRKITPKEGLIIGAMAGAGFGIFEAVWIHNQVFMYGWTWDAISRDWITALMPFWERLWTVALHIGISALAGYGLAKGKGWQFYLLASILHGVANYLILPLQKGMMTSNQTEICLAVIAGAIMLAALWLRWRKEKEIPATPMEAIEPPKPDIPANTDV